VDEVHLWHRLTEPTGGTVHEFEEHVLSPEESARRDRYRFEPDRRDYAVAHDLLRRSLSRYGATPPHAWRFGVGANGKPFLSDAGLSFNLSHTRGLVACGIARAMPVGIDVERTDRQIQTATLAERFFSAPEAASLGRGSTNAGDRFFDLWTLKEAFIKAIGTGLSQPLNSFSFDLDRDDRSIGFAAPGFDAAEWQFALYAPLPDARLAVAVHARGKRRVRWHAREILAYGIGRIEPIRTSAG
jgi:4'-phosphopantetheinyl transferase